MQSDGIVRHVAPDDDENYSMVYHYEDGDWARQ